MSKYNRSYLSQMNTINMGRYSLKYNFKPKQVAISVEAPPMCFCNIDGIKGFSIALSDAINSMFYEVEVIEETRSYKN